MTAMTNLQDSAQKKLRQYIEQVERLEEEKKGLSADIREKYLEAKAAGFDPKIMRKMVKMRRMSEQERSEEEALVAVYMSALGMLADTPLGEFAMDSVRQPARGPRLVETAPAEAAE